MAATAEIITKPGSKRDLAALDHQWARRRDLVYRLGRVELSAADSLRQRPVPLVPMVAAWAILIRCATRFRHLLTHLFRSHLKERIARDCFGDRCCSSRLDLCWCLPGAGFVFFFVAALWAYYHLVKQHYGFMVLYKKKNGDLARIDNALDRLLLLFAFNYPFVGVSSPEIRRRWHVCRRCCIRV
jgi:hypothetical protein